MAFFPLVPDAEQIGPRQLGGTDVHGIDEIPAPCSTEEVQAKFRKGDGRGLSTERAGQLSAACEKNMDALKQDPYCYLDGKTVVKISFPETDTTMEDCLDHYLRGL